MVLNIFIERVHLYFDAMHHSSCGCSGCGGCSGCAEG